MLTAGHVVEELTAAAKAGKGVASVGIFHPKSFKQFGLRVSDLEVLGCDIGLLKVDFQSPDQVDWLFPLWWDPFTSNMGTLVRSPGFAYGDHRVGDARYIVQRSFQGTIVADIGSYLPLGMTGEPFGVFELSFGAPRGHSGAPLLHENGRVMGVVIGNSKSRMLVLDSEELEESTGTKTVVQQYESLTLGIAVRASNAVTLMSHILGTTLGHFISKSERIPGYTPPAI